MDFAFESVEAGDVGDVWWRGKVGLGSTKGRIIGKYSHRFAEKPAATIRYLAVAVRPS